MADELTMTVRISFAAATLEEGTEIANAINFPEGSSVTIDVSQTVSRGVVIEGIVTPPTI